MKNTKIVYTGVFFNLSELFNKFNANIGEPRLARIIENPHVTFAYQPKEINPALFGELVTFRVIGYANDGKNQGLQVELVDAAQSVREEYYKIETPHITVSIGEGCRAVNTAHLDFRPIENPFTISGFFGGLCSFFNNKIIYDLSTEKLNGINPKAFDTKDYYPDEIAETLCKLAFEYPGDDTIHEVEEALYQLKATAENPYNRDYYRILYRVLEKIAERDERG